MIIDLQHFIAAEAATWSELEQLLDRVNEDPLTRLTLAEAQRFHYLYERTSADLGKLMTFASEPELRHYLEGLVARAYGEIHETRRAPQRFRPGQWFFGTFPRTFRRHSRAFALSVAVTVIGMMFGAGALTFDPDVKAVLLPFGHLQGEPSERVAEEEQHEVDRLGHVKSTFASVLMTHNTKVSIFALALGMTWGVGSIILLFYNGIILGAVGADYIWAGESPFLFGWLLPHGAIEIPAILIAGQAGLVLAAALLGAAGGVPLWQRLRNIAPDLVTLIGGVGVMLVWAGFVEAFLSQYHEPVIPYWSKIVFGVSELVLLALFLTRSGRTAAKPTETHAAP